MKESPISALYDALLPSLKQHAPKDKTLELLKYYCDKIYQEGELNGRTALLLDLELKARHEPELTTFEVDRIVGFIDFYKSQLERKEQ